MKEKEKKYLLRTIETIKHYCTNLREVIDNVGYDITTEIGAVTFLKERAARDSSCPEDYFRFVLIDGYYVAIDEPIADLINRLNKNDMKTMFCCCGHSLRSERAAVQYYISFKFGEKEFALMSSVYKKLTGVNCFKYRDREERVSTVVSDAFKGILKNVAVTKRDTKEFMSSFAWNQSLDIHYYSSKREEALILINNIINNCIDEVNENFNNHSVFGNRTFDRLCNFINVSRKKVSALIKRSIESR